MPHRLTNLRVDEGSLVRKPANKGALVVLFKRADERPRPEPAPEPEPGILAKIRALLGMEKQSPSESMGAGISQEELQQICTKKKTTWRNGNPITEAQRKAACAAMSKAAGDPVPMTYDDVVAQYQFGEFANEAREMLGALGTAMSSIVYAADIDLAKKKELLAQSWGEFTSAFGDALSQFGEDGQQSTDVGKAGRRISAARMTRLQAAMEQIKSLLRDGSYADRKPAAKGENMDRSKLDKEALAYIEELEKKAGIKPEPVDVLKGLSPEARALVEKAQKDAADAQAASIETRKLLDAERDARRTADVLNKAATLKGIPGKTDELAAVLKAAGDVMPAEQYQKLWETLQAASGAIEQSAAFREAGSAAAGTGDGGALAKIEQLTAQKMADAEKTGKRLTKAEAMSAVMSEQPKLYTDYLAETTKQ